MTVTRIRIFGVATAIIAAAVLTLALGVGQGIGGDDASQARLFGSKVTVGKSSIEAVSDEDGLRWVTKVKGKVKSREAPCVRNRKVIVFGRLSGTRDEKLGTTRTSVKMNKKGNAFGKWTFERTTTDRPLFAFLKAKIKGKQFGPKITSKRRKHRCATDVGLQTDDPGNS